MAFSFRTYDQFHRDILLWMQHVPTISAVAGIPRSGCIAADMIAQIRHIPLVTLDSLRSGVAPVPVKGIRTPYAVPGPVLIVDDTCGGGHTILGIKPSIANPNVIWGAVYASDQAVKKRIVDVAGYRLTTPNHTYAWNLFRDSVTKTLLTDFDGVLCPDWGLPDTGVHLKAYEEWLTTVPNTWLVTEKLRAIVTARLEKYRPQTEEWLARHGIKYDFLFMHPNCDPNQRNPVAHKVACYRQLCMSTSAFVESCPGQAQAIAKKTGWPVLCFTTGQLHKPAPIVSFDRTPVVVPPARPSRPLVSPTRNLIYHCFAVAKSSLWKWNLEELSKRIGLFNGKRVLSISHEPTSGPNQTVDPQEVLRYSESIGIDWTAHQVVQNDPKIGEVKSFSWLLSQVYSLDPNEITLYAHAKGVRWWNNPEKETVVKRWAESLYRYCLDDIEGVQRSLASHSIAGPYLRYDKLGKEDRYFSGAYYWVRNADLFVRDWMRVTHEYTGVEQYPALHFRTDEMACLSHFVVGDLYKQSEWDAINKAVEGMNNDGAEAATTTPKVIALYLPAFHRDPINDRAWGDGWTEWDNLRRWAPIFTGHTIQRPHADLGEYDLLDVATRRKQAEMAKAHGVYGFAVYHYWFNGTKALNQPYERMLLDGEPDLPFCFVWANEHWTKRWDGLDKEVIQAQTYGDQSEWKAHAEYLRPFLEHRNYIRIDGKRIVGLYRPGTIPQLAERLAFYRETLGDDLHFSVLYGPFCDEQTPAKYPCLDSAIEFHPHADMAEGCKGIAMLSHQRLFRGVSTGFDNSPRVRSGGLQITAQPFADQLNRLRSEEYIFVNAWNEWGEQAVIEPSDRDGYSRLKEIANLTRKADSTAQPRVTIAELCQKYRTDKGTIHSYPEVYDAILPRHRESAKRVLEIGCLRGESLRMWAEYFPFAEITGLDINHVPVACERVRTIQGNAYSDAVLRRLTGQFDIIIDDGPHTLESWLYLLKNYTPLLAPGGTFVIEDIYSDEPVAALLNAVPESMRPHTSIVDRRSIKGRYDDMLLVIDLPR